MSSSWYVNEEIDEKEEAQVKTKLKVRLTITE